ncbi:substrate-binding domain-containing protein [Belliella sp. DSM 111904]|uniref:histidine kinase n=1 Tax=Belliella filtrata TaxID=2923435 RepID=A0ABS9UVP7_9BACT|nr:substrate-binding domain-containing protein [Belliella filtrata]MCH7408243.1 substrate-binding domain-containing protein [Belliella filtrata]
MTLKFRYISLLYILSLFTHVSCDVKEERKLVIGFSQCVSNDAWREAMHEEMYRELSFYPSLDLVIKDAGGDSKVQIENIKAFQEMGVDLLIVSPNESAPITGVVEEVFQSGIPVIVVDRNINSSQFSAYIGGDSFEIGKTVGQYILNTYPNDHRILEIWGLKGSSPAKERHQGLRSTIDGSDHYIKYQIDGEWEREVAKERFREFLKSNQDAQFDIVFCHNDVMAISASEVCKEFGLVDVKILGIDALPGPRAGLQAVSDGVLDATFFYPTGGDKAIEVAWKILSNDSFEKLNFMQTAPVDFTNIRVIKQQTDRIINQQANIIRQSEMIASQVKIYNNQRGLLIVFGMTLLIAVVSLGFVFKSLKEKQVTNKKLKRKNDEILNQKEQIVQFAKDAEEATQYKLEFFTNVSHEFRTPLTLIQGPVEDMLANSNASPFKENLILIRKNTYRLLRLVNQLLDFRKIDSGKLAIRVSEITLESFILEIMSVFMKHAKDEQIRFKLFCEDSSLKLWCDPLMLDKVIFNLLSNSFKFTPKKGSVSIRVFKDSLNYEAVIQIEDTGEGMSEEELKHVFDRFYQGSSGVRNIGSGLGLALARELVEIQQGQIHAQSKLGESTVFEIRMKLGKDHFQKGDFLETDFKDLVLDHESYVADESTKPAKIRDNLEAEKSILVVEDDKEIREYLRRGLSHSYQILEAQNIDVAFSLAVDNIPDLITCDLMIKSQNGFDLVAKLKDDSRTSSIPIIVISAKSSQEDHLTGVKLGVDDFMSKPFSITFLIERINNIFKNRSKIEERFLHSLAISEDKSIESSTKKVNKKFINEFRTAVEENMSNPEIGVNDICRQLGLSRGQLYRKVKAELGYSVNDYIVKVRLQKAKFLLGDGNLSISEIGFQTGFKTAAYFSTVFKNSYGMTPSEFREKRKS